MTPRHGSNYREDLVCSWVCGRRCWRRVLSLVATLRKKGSPESSCRAVQCCSVRTKIQAKHQSTCLIERIDAAGCSALSSCAPCEKCFTVHKGHHRVGLRIDIGLHTSHLLLLQQCDLLFRIIVRETNENRGFESAMDKPEIIILVSHAHIGPERTDAKSCFFGAWLRTQSLCVDSMSLLTFCFLLRFFFFQTGGFHPRFS